VTRRGEGLLEDSRRLGPPHPGHLPAEPGTARARAADPHAMQPTRVLKRALGALARPVRLRLVDDRHPAVPGRPVGTRPRVRREPLR
jgi:hypothetical protein